MMEYNGYQAAVKYDYEAEVFHGEVVGTRDVIFFEADSVGGLKKEFQFSIDDYLAMCAERGQDPDRPFSGKVPLRLNPDLHRAATAAAKAAGKSLNAWITETVEAATSGVSAQQLAEGRARYNPSISTGSMLSETSKPRIRE